MLLHLLQVRGRVQSRTPCRARGGGRAACGVGLGEGGHRSHRLSRRGWSGRVSGRALDSLAGMQAGAEGNGLTAAGDCRCSGRGRGWDLGGVQRGNTHCGTRAVCDAKCVGVVVRRCLAVRVVVTHPSPGSDIDGSSPERDAVCDARQRVSGAQFAASRVGDLASASESSVHRRLRDGGSAELVFHRAATICSVHGPRAAVRAPSAWRWSRPPANAVVRLSAYLDCGSGCLVQLDNQPRAGRRPLSRLCSTGTPR